MMDNEETPTQGGDAPSAPPPQAAQNDQQPSFQGEPGNGALRTARPPRTGDAAGDAAAVAAVGVASQASPAAGQPPPQGGNVAPQGAGNGAAAAPAPQPQGQPEVTEEVEGVLDFEGKGQGWLRDPKRSPTSPRASTSRCRAGSSTACTCCPATS